MPGLCRCFGKKNASAANPNPSPLPPPLASTEAAEPVPDEVPTEKVSEAPAQAQAPLPSQGSSGRASDRKQPELDAGFGAQGTEASGTEASGTEAPGNGTAGCAWTPTPFELRVGEAGDGADQDLREAQASIQSAEATEEPVAPAVPDGGWSVFAQRAEAEAAELMREHRTLEAEAALVGALGRLEAESAPGRSEALEAAKRLRAAEVLGAVQMRLGQYEDIGRSALGGNDFALSWEADWAKLWVHAPAGQCWFEYRVALDVEAPLSHCMVTVHELDLAPKAQPMLSAPPKRLGDFCNSLVVTQALISMLMFRLELIIEASRFFNNDFGFLAENVVSDFDKEGRPIPSKGWGVMRADVNAKNIWLPMGGGKPGTVILQVTRVELPVRVPEWVLSHFFSVFAPTMLGNMKKSALMVSEPGNPWTERLERDADGLYAALRTVEKAAARRQTVTATSLPTDEVFRRLAPLSQSLGSRPEEAEGTRS